MAERRSRTFRLVMRATLAVVLVALVSAVIYFLYLDRIVTRQFEGRRWTLPAQVYAAPLELYAGLHAVRRGDRARAHAAAVPEVASLVEPGDVPQAGHAHRRGAARRALRGRSAAGADPAHRHTDATAISAPAGQPQGKEVPIVRLEPLLIGSIFPIHGEDRIVVTPQDVPALLPPR